MELVVGTKVEIKCHSSGSRPHASITWWIDNENLQGELSDLITELNNNAKGVMFSGFFSLTTLILYVYIWFVGISRVRVVCLNPSFCYFVLVCGINCQ